MSKLGLVGSPGAANRPFFVNEIDARLLLSSNRCGELMARCRRLETSIAVFLSVLAAVRLLALRAILWGGLGGVSTDGIELKKASVFESLGHISIFPEGSCEGMRGLGSGVIDLPSNSFRLRTLRIELDFSKWLDALNGYTQALSVSIPEKPGICSKPRPCRPSVERLDVPLSIGGDVTSTKGVVEKLSEPVLGEANLPPSDKPPRMAGERAGSIDAVVI